MAQKSQQAYLSVATAQTATKTITGITNASPGAVTSAAHGLAIGDVGIITTVVGMTQVNGRAFVVANSSSPLSTGSFELAGVDTSLSVYSTYSSGGIWTPQTMTEIAEIRGITSAFDGEAADIDVTNLRSTGKEYLTGLPEFGNVALNLWLPTSSDTGQTKLRSLRETQASAAFSITLASGLRSAFVGLVKSFSVTGIEVDGAIQCGCTIKVTNQPAWFA